jgi:hypothetical protein
MALKAQEHGTSILLAVSQHGANGSLCKKERAVSWRERTPEPGREAGVSLFITIHFRGS